MIGQALQQFFRDSILAPVLDIDDKKPTVEILIGGRYAELFIIRDWPHCGQMALASTLVSEHDIGIDKWRRTFLNRKNRVSGLWLIPKLRKVAQDEHVGIDVDGSLDVCGKHIGNHEPEVGRKAYVVANGKASKAV